MVTCACMHGIAHAQFCSRPNVVVIIPGTLTADGGCYNWRRRWDRQPYQREHGHDRSIGSFQARRGKDLGIP